MPRKKSDSTPVVNTENKAIGHIITLLSSAIQTASGAKAGTLEPVTLAVGPVTFSGLNGGSVTFTVGNLPLSPLLTWLDTLQKK